MVQEHHSTLFGDGSEGSGLRSRVERLEREHREDRDRRARIDSLKEKILAGVTIGIVMSLIALGFRCAVYIQTLLKP